MGSRVYLLIIVSRRIRGFYDNALYKFTFHIHIHIHIRDIHVYQTSLSLKGIA